MRAEFPRSAWSTGSPKIGEFFIYGGTDVDWVRAEGRNGFFIYSGTLVEWLGGYLETRFGEIGEIGEITGVFGEKRAAVSLFRGGGGALVMVAGRALRHAVAVYIVSREIFRLAVQLGRRASAEIGRSQQLGWIFIF